MNYRNKLVSHTPISSLIYGPFEENTGLKISVPKPSPKTPLCAQFCTNNPDPADRQSPVLRQRADPDASAACGPAGVGRHATQLLSVTTASPGVCYQYSLSARSHSRSASWPAPGCQTRTGPGAARGPSPSNRAQAPRLPPSRVLAFPKLIPVVGKLVKFLNLSQFIFVLRLVYSSSIVSRLHRRNFNFSS